MSDTLKSALDRFSLSAFPKQWGLIQRGIEKESLRVTANGRLSQQPHPEALGSALTHPYITTDYSEALLELITPVSNDIDESLNFLQSLHNYVYDHLPDGERLWVSSMPCLLESEADIPLAQYGSSNMGRLKTLYREGLGHRYGRLMQTISGIHYNFSMPDAFWQEMYDQSEGFDSLQAFRTHKYLHLIRNFHRYSWLLVYLFGASPAVCSCFTRGRSHQLESFDPHTLYLPYATCLRMGDLGYRSDAQGSIYVCYNDLGNYIDSLYQALSTPYRPYQEIDQGVAEGEHRQINSNLLQLENEFYATIRPKRVGSDGRRPLELLKAEGIQYIEVRALDLNPYLPLGLDATQIRFLDSFLLFCLLADSPACHKDEHQQIEQNLSKTVNRGREPGLTLTDGANTRTLKEWATDLLSQIQDSAILLDSVASQPTQHQQAVSAQLAKVNDPELTPSAQILADMRRHQQTFGEFARQRSSQTLEALRGHSHDDEQQQQAFSEASQQSLTEQRAAEAADTLSFEDFLREWNDYKLD